MGPGYLAGCGRVHDGSFFRSVASSRRYESLGMVCNPRSDHCRTPDPDHPVGSAYGAYGEKKLYGKTTTGVIRSTFVIDADGKVEKAMYAVKATGHVGRLLAELGA